MKASQILSIIAGGLVVLTYLTSAPLVPVAVIVLAIAVFLAGRGI